MKKANSIELLPSSSCDRRWSFRQQSFHGSSERKEQVEFTFIILKKSFIITSRLKINVKRFGVSRDLDVSCVEIAPIIKQLLFV